MSIPKVIYQTYSTTKIPWYAKWQIWYFRRKHRDYKYVFYTDTMINDFVKKNFNSNVYETYSKLQIGVAKADFFRYAILYVNGGIYLDLDSSIRSNLNNIIGTTETAIIAREKTNKHLYAQWALIYERQHPILKQTIGILLNNINNKKYPNDIISATGPLPYSQAVHHYLKNNPNDENLKVVKDNYKGIFIFKTIPARIHELLNKSKHWRQIQKVKSIYKEE